MRGPLLSGPVGSSATLARLAAIAREQQPVAVLSSLWLAEALSSEVRVVALIEPDKARAGRKALVRAQREGRALTVVVAGGDLPVAPGALGAVIVDGLTDLDQAAAVALLADVVPALRPGGTVVAADASRNVAMEQRLAGIFIAAPLLHIRQERPREGAVLTIGRVPPAIVMQALAHAHA